MGQALGGPAGSDDWPLDASRSPEMNAESSAIVVMTDQ
jgi:hypothetical protein